MPKGNKNQRHKQKREAKKAANRRRESISPLKRLADSPGKIECWMTNGFEPNGQMQAFIHKQAAGLTGIACFLIDQGVVGLKDVWTRMNVSRSEFDDLLARCDSQGLPVYRVTPDAVAKTVAGGLRWAWDNGMRLPKEWAKAAAFIGGVGAWESADVSAFKKSFAGHPEDLRQRLISESFESYVQRADIEFIFSTAPFMDQETGEYRNNGDDDLETDDDPDFFGNISTEELNELAAKFTTIAMALTTETIAWLTARNESPSSEILEAWRSIMIAVVMSKSAMPDGSDAEVFDFGQKLLDELEARIDEPSLPEYQTAVDQALEFLDTDPEMVPRAIRKSGMANEP